MTKKMKYLKPRGDWYHFERVLSKPLQAIMGKTGWRESLNTDSRVEAEARCRRRTVETDEEIQQAKEGKFRRLSKIEVEDLAAQWCIDFQLINRENIAREAFSDVLGEPDPLGDEAKTPIIRKKADLLEVVRNWLVRTNNDRLTVGSADWDALLDAWLDEYLVSNPEISDAWQQIHAELGLENTPTPVNVFGTLKRSPKVDPRHRLSAVFKQYLKINTNLGKSARSDFGTAVRRFIEFHGDIGVENVERVHVEQFRDALIRLPVRPPNKIRSQTIKKQVAWAEENIARCLKQGAINKNLMGVKLTLDFAFEETSIIKDRNWRNPCDGFSKAVGTPDNPVEAFTEKQLQLVFSERVFRPKTAERFWVPLVLFYTGARLDEICQLHVTDIIFARGNPPRK